MTSGYIYKTVQIKTEMARNIVAVHSCALTVFPEYMHAHALLHTHTHTTCIIAYSSANCLILLSFPLTLSFLSHCTSSVFQSLYFHLKSVSTWFSRPCYIHSSSTVSTTTFSHIFIITPTHKLHNFFNIPINCLLEGWWWWEWGGWNIKRNGKRKTTYQLKITVFKH